MSSVASLKMGIFGGVIILSLNIQSLFLKVFNDFMFGFE